MELTTETDIMKKTIKNYCLNATKRKLNQLYKIAQEYGNVKNEVFRLYGSIEGLKYLKYSRAARDRWVKTKYADRFNLQARLWKCAFEEAFANVKTNWKRAFLKVRQLLYNNSNFSEDEKYYCFYLLRATDLLYQVLKLEPFCLPHAFKEKDIDITRCRRYLKRQIRRHQGKRPMQKKKRSFTLDSCMYSYFSRLPKGQLWLAVMGIKPGKRIKLRLTSDRQFSGNIRIVLQGKRVEIHGTEEVAVALPSKLDKNNNVIAIDKGFTDLITTSKNTRYGKDFNLLSRRESDRLSQKNVQRNKLKSLSEKYRKQNNIKKAARIERHNLRKKKYNRLKAINKHRLADFINLSLNLFFKENRVNVLVVESLKFSNWNKKLSKKVKRYFSSWLKGYLQKRIAYKCQENSVLLSEVNPAYTSQVCSLCGSLDTIRKDSRLHCTNCGRDVDANYNASLNLLLRYNDPEISLYTPYKRVRYILEERFSRSVETGQPGVETPRTALVSGVNPTANCRMSRIV